MEKHADSTPFFKDRLAVSLLVFNGVLIIANVLATVIRLGSHDFKVPVQYMVSDSSVLQTANWYSLYSLAVFALVGGGVTIALAYRLHQGNRRFSIALLALYTVVGVVTFLVINALLALVARV